MKPLARLVLVFAVAGLFALVAPSTAQDRLTYKSGYSSMMKLGKDIHGALPSEHRAMISAQPISIETDSTPFVRLLYYKEEPNPIRGVWISAGFIDLVNNVAHAKAIDLKERNYFERYIEILSRETGDQPLRPLPNDSNPRYWTDEMLNEQLSNFNSIVGIVVAVKLAHHYLGHYDKYKDKLVDAQGKPVPIANLLTESEWEEAFQLGVRNALEAGCTIEGVIPFFEAFDKMKNRPPWTAYFWPEKVKFSKMRREMQRIQRDFFQ